ncbi:MAG: phosphate ABC transporter permease subunit PstC [Succinatimonas sp.]|nr:phosphate ABC transporter permease subunit PstC [Succinatimonas sp.]
MQNNHRKCSDRIALSVFMVLGYLNIVFVAVICLYLLISGVPAIFKIGFTDFIFGTKWASTASEPYFGIMPFILTSVYGTVGAIILGLPVGFFTSAYLAKFAPKKLKAAVESVVDLLAGIPSVVFGFIGMLVLVPGIQKIFDVPDGASLLAAIFVLAVMILPSIIKVSIGAIEAVPHEYELGSLALGANKIETVFKVVIPAANRGIGVAVVLGVGRAIGEAMAVMMVAGNVANMPHLFESVRFLTTAVASEMSYSHGLQREALFSIALVLFVFIMVINALLNLVLKKRGSK